MRRSFPFLAIAILAGPASAASVASGDWRAGCDNMRACTAIALAAAGAKLPHLPLVVRRDGGPADAAALIVPLDGRVAGGKRASLFVDGSAIAGLIAPLRGGLALPLDRRLVTALSAGRGVVLVDGDGRSLAAASLGGFVAALRRIDAEQQRTGTAAALVRPGRRLATIVPPAPPSIAVPPAGGMPPRTLSGKVAAKLFGRGCRIDVATIRAARLDATHSLAFVPAGCDARSALFVIDEKSRPWAGGLDGVEHLPAGLAWSDADRTFTADDRHDGCGTTRRWTWDGAGFRLSAASEHWRCRGATEPIVTWRTTLTD